MEWGALYLLLLALHSLCIDGYYYFVLQCITNFALAYRKRGRTDFLLARMVYPIAHRGTHPRNTRGLYTWLWLYCFAFWHWPDGVRSWEEKRRYIARFRIGRAGNSLKDVNYCNIRTGLVMRCLLKPHGRWLDLFAMGWRSHSYPPLISPLGIFSLGVPNSYSNSSPWIVRYEGFIHSSIIISYNPVVLMIYEGNLYTIINFVYILFLASNRRYSL